MAKQFHLLPADVREIAERVSLGEKLLHVLSEQGISPADFFKHLDKVPEDKLLFEQARRVAVEVLIDESSNLYDSVASKLDLEIAKAKVGLRQWLAEKIIPATYGTKIQHDVSGTINIKAALGEANARVLRVVDNLSTHPPIQTETREKLLPDIEAAFTKANSLPSSKASEPFAAAPGLSDADPKPEDLF